jgi:hypothetical protein
MLRKNRTRTMLLPARVDYTVATAYHLRIPLELSGS